MVREEINIILSKKGTKSNSAIKAEHGAFAQKYPVLFDMLLHPKPIDMNILNMMLSMVDDVKEQKTDIDEASKRVGEQLNEKYVFSKLPNLRPSSK